MILEGQHKKITSETNFMGYQMIVEDTNEKYIYLNLKGGKKQEISRTELLEMIKNRKPLPALEIIEKK